MASTSRSKEISRTDSQELALANISDLMDKVPAAGGDGFSIIEDILAAQSATDLIGTDDGTLPKAEEFFDHDIRVDSIKSAASDFEDVANITDRFLIVEGHDLTTDSPVMFSIGAQSAVIKLAKLNSFMAFPATVRFSRAKKATANGYYPVNMAVLTVTESV